PMVVDAATMAYDAVSMLAQELANNNPGLNDNMIKDTVNKVLSEKLGAMIVTPKEIDMLVDDAADMVASGLNFALHGISEEEIKSYLY
ncbi:MAG TPA: GPR endopeptidase, partial [Clostridia bacterium]|nr:GPR endopeptidase [Clostridia bacterium]